MNAVATLFWQSFTGSRLSRVLSVLGIALFCTGIVAQINVPGWTLGVGNYQKTSLTFQTLLQLLPWQAVIALFLATASQPRVIHGLVVGHCTASLPNLRRSALLSTVAVAAAVALAAAIPAALFFVGYPIEVDVAAVFRRAFAIAFINFGLLYLAFWAFAFIRGIWFFVGPVLLVIAFAILPAMLNPQIPLLNWRFGLGVAGWLSYAALIIGGHRLVYGLARLRPVTRASIERWFPFAAVTPAPNVSSLLGADRGWIAIAVQCVPIALALWLLPARLVLLFSLVLFSAINGARSTFAASRSRSLWLRTDWPIKRFFRQMEKAFWIPGIWSLATAVLLFVGTGVLVGFPTRLMGYAIGLMGLATAAGLYLGLMMTRGLRIPDAGIAAATMVLLLFTALIAAPADASVPTVIALEVTLALLTAVLRAIAKSRWASIDWMLCRPGSAAAPAAG